MKTTFWEKNKRTICNLILVAVLVALVGCVDAFAPSSSMWFPVLRKVCTFALAAVAMNLLNGFTGLFSLGQAGFMLLGAYAYAILTIPVELRSTVFRNYGDSLVQFQMPLVLALLAAGVVAAFFAFLIGLPVLRLKSDYLAIATLGFAEIVRGLVQLSQFGPLTNGPDPLNNFTAPKSVMPYAAIAGVCILLIVLLINSTYGRAFKAIRDDEIAAEAMGINLARHKMISFVVSSFFCGVAGAMLAMCNTSVSSVSFTTSMTYQIRHCGVHLLRQQRVVAAIPGSGDVHRIGRTGPPAGLRLPHGGVLRADHDRGAVLPQGHHGHPRGVGV